MARSLLLLALAVSTAVWSTGARAATDKYAITAEEHAACDTDAVTLCSAVRPDEDSLLVCMRGKRAQLSPACKVVLAAGMRKRHIPF